MAHQSLKSASFILARDQDETKGEHRKKIDWESPLPTVGLKASSTAIGMIMLAL